MTQQEYEQKKCECWEEFKREEQCLPASRHDVFCAAFDRAYALCKQEKDAENTPISERLYEEEKSRLEGIYYYLKRAADKQENESVSVAVLFEVMERLEDIFGIDLLTNGHGKRAPKDADTVIQGWVCRDEDNTLTLFYGSNKPSKEDGDDYWSAVYGNALEYLNQNLFPDVKWEDAEPTKVEITIKRKKK